MFLLKNDTMFGINNYHIIMNKTFVRPLINNLLSRNVNLFACTSLFSTSQKIHQSLPLKTFLGSSSIEHGKREIYRTNDRYMQVETDNDGNLLKQYTFRLAPVIRDQVLIGPNQSWYSDGTPHRICSYKNGKLDGNYEQFYPNGQLHIRCSLQDGKLKGKYEEFNCDGKLVSEHTY